ncbi:MAG: hypothetical protein Q9167_004548 [Letrouitia subvulpina]
MAFRQPEGSPKRASPGQILTVIHDFEARSPDELSLVKGEKIELIERDDDFGDGWYLGKHLLSGKTGLFPEVYTKVWPLARTNNSFPSNVSSGTIPSLVVATERPPANTGSSQLEQSIVTARAVANSIQHNGNSRTISPTPPPLNTTPPSQKVVSPSNTAVALSGTIASNLAPKSISLALGNQRGPGEESPVMNETLSVIDEHITDMNTPGSSLRTEERRGTNDSSSEYSSHIDHRLSYIAGTETDEEERSLHTRRAVMAWTPSQVSDNLRDMGVESRHCEIFKEQEISGEVLLCMEQSTLFMKELDLGLVGRRLRTWHKIKALQEEVRESEAQSNNITHPLGVIDTTSDDILSSRNGSNISPGPQVIAERPSSRRSHSRQTSQNAQSNPSAQQRQSQHRDSPKTSSFVLKSGPDSPGRPSAASIREFNHSRRHSAIEPVSPPTPDIIAGKNGNLTPNRTVTSPHKKSPSFDRSWTMGVSSRATSARPISAISMSTDHNTFDPVTKDSGYYISSTREFDRGYVSGGEVEGRRSRNVLKKRDAVSANHSRNNSYLEDHQRANQVGAKRQSRFSSVDSIRDTVASMASPASRAHQGNSVKGRFRNSSANEMVTTAPIRNTLNSPVVTKLEYDEKPRMSVLATLSKPSSPKPPGELSSFGSPSSSCPSPNGNIKPRVGLRAISDAVTGSEKVLVESPISTLSPAKESDLNSPARTGSTTPSRASQSLDRESTDVSSKGTSAPQLSLTPTSGTTRQKRKQDTSAYVRGLIQKSPQEQMVGCDYSGWMKKKSSNLMTKWKPRLFVLRGRRLSYYYSENDTQEKGLIDISSHRVLPADNDIITGLHATVTRAKSSPVSPQNTHTPTIASQEAAAMPEPISSKDKGDAMFIFKLVPPRAGLSRAVNFTKPTIHYFAVENVIQGRLWMAALMKATIDRDDTKPITTTYQQKTISLAKARMLRHRPPALMNLDEKSEGVETAPKSDETGLNIQGVNFGESANGQEHKRAGSLGNEPPTDARTE